MTNALLVITALLFLAQGVALWLLWRRNQKPATVAVDLSIVERGLERVERSLRDEVARHREETNSSSRHSREEQQNVLSVFAEAVAGQMQQIAQAQKSQLDTFATLLSTLTQSNEQRLSTLRDSVERKLGVLQADAVQQQAAARDEQSRTAKAVGDLVIARLTDSAALQKDQLERFSLSIASLTSSNEQKLDRMRETVEGRLTALQNDNAAKLELMRQTVDEKLHATLEQRLGESFKQVTERLEVVHRGLGEMQTLASGVGDLKKVLTNIKTRGNWGEIQLGNLLEQMFHPDQYAANVQVNPTGSERVEFAIKLPGKDPSGKSVWLPIDAKFPREDYERLIDAADRGDADGVIASADALQARVCTEAKKIRDKYISPPDTVDFAIMFLPTEGLYAEVLRRPGLCDGLLRDHRVHLAGPTTLAALLSSLQMGFRTLAIERRSSEVWEVLGAVKNEFGRFGDMLTKVQKKLQEATNSVDDAARRSRAVTRKLKSVQELPDAQSQKLLDTSVQTDSVSDLLEKADG